MARIYLASSWRNPFQQMVLRALRYEGHEVYDFRNPEPGDHGFSWSEIDPHWKTWTPEQFKEQVFHPAKAHIADRGYRYDKRGMDWATHGVLLLPCGLSAHLEAGWLGGQGKPVCVFALGMREPELMYKLFDDVPAIEDTGWARQTFCTTFEEVRYFLRDTPTVERVAAPDMRLMDTVESMENQIWRLKKRDEDATRYAQEKCAYQDQVDDLKEQLALLQHGDTSAPGKEAEELRSGIEAIVKTLDDDPYEHGSESDTRKKLLKLLDEVSARDSERYLESQDKAAELPGLEDGVLGTFRTVRLNDGTLIDAGQAAAPDDGMDMFQGYTGPIEIGVTHDGIGGNTGNGIVLQAKPDHDLGGEG